MLLVFSIHILKYIQYNTYPTQNVVNIITQKPDFGQLLRKLKKGRIVLKDDLNVWFDGL